MRIADRLRELGFTREESRRTPPRHAALRDDAAALALRLFRDHGALTPEEIATLDFPAEVLHYRCDIIEHLYLFSDWRGTGPDEVLPPGETTAILYRAACATGRVLDLGCGSGTLALLLAPQAEQVIGTDINPRAIALSRLNAEVNGIGNVEFREGSLFDPVEGEQFDLIVSQPPYIPKPANVEHHLFLHGGARGDELAREIIAKVKAYLRPRGQALIYSDWPLKEGETVQDRIPVEGQFEISGPITLEAYERIYESPAAEGVTQIRQCVARFTV